MYPAGFADPAIAAIRKKHKVDRLVRFTQECLEQPSCDRPQFMAETLWTTVGRSSRVS